MIIDDNNNFKKSYIFKTNLLLSIKLTIFFNLNKSSN